MVERTGEVHTKDRICVWEDFGGYRTIRVYEKSLTKLFIAFLAFSITIRFFSSTL
jgi:hypothetical protein